MILKCSCFNTEADTLYGKGYRPHAKLAFRFLVTESFVVGHLQEYICNSCMYVRTTKEDGKKYPAKTAMLLPGASHPGRLGTKALDMHKPYQGRFHSSYHDRHELVVRVNSKKSRLTTKRISHANTHAASGSI